MTSLSYKMSTSPPLPTPPEEVDSNFLPPPPPPRRLARTPPPPPPFQPRRGSLWDFVKSEATGAWDSVGSLARSKEGVESFHPTELPLEAAKAARILRSFTMDSIDLPLDNPSPEAQKQQSKKLQKVMKKIPPSAMEHCQGLAIFTVMRTGFLVSGAGGSGVVLARLPDGTWSPPSGILIHTIGFGVVAGANVYDVVLLLRTTKAVNSFSHPRVTLGGELAISNGPWEHGAGLRVLETGVEISPVWSYVKSKNSYGGVQVDGNVVIERNDENERSYGRPVTACEILDGAVEAPDWCSGLHQTILAAEGKDFSPSLIPNGVSPSEGLSPTQEEITASSSSSTSSNEPSFSDLSIRRTSTSTASSFPTSTSIRKLPQEDLDDEDLAARREMEAMLKEFGIENPNINKEMREVDPLLVRGNSHGNSNANSFVEHTPPMTPPEKTPLSLEENVEEPTKKSDSEEEEKGESVAEGMAGLGLSGLNNNKISAEEKEGKKVEEVKAVEDAKPVVEVSEDAPVEEKDGDDTEKEEASKEEKEESAEDTDKEGEDDVENFETPTVEEYDTPEVEQE